MLLATNESRNGDVHIGFAKHELGRRRGRGGEIRPPPGARARVALSGLTMAEYFRDQEGQDVLFFVDNIFRFSPVRAGPDDLARFHGTNERIASRNLVEMIRFYHRLATLSAATLTALLAGAGCGAGCEEAPWARRPARWS